MALFFYFFVKVFSDEGTTNCCFTCKAVAWAHPEFAYWRLAIWLLN